MSAAEIIRSSKDRELGSPVRTADDLNKMIRQWQRFNEVKRPGSTKPHALETGEVVPEYFVQERKRWVRAENRKRKSFTLLVFSTPLRTPRPSTIWR